jgi:hypothetical protein
MESWFHKREQFCIPEIDTGRVARAVWGLGLIIAGFFFFDSSKIVSVLLFLFGAFALYEALRGWCIMRACGVKTKL